MIAFEFEGDRLAEGIVHVGVLEPAPDGLDQLEELVRLPFGLADDEDVREDIVVALMQLVEEHGASIRPSFMRADHGGVGDCADRGATRRLRLSGCRCR